MYGEFWQLQISWHIKSTLNQRVLFVKSTFRMPFRPEGAKRFKARATPWYAFLNSLNALKGQLEKCYTGKMPQSLCAVYIHLVFSTKERRALLTDPLRSDLHAYLGGVLKERGSSPVSINSVPDHVHLLFSLPRTVTIAQMVEDLKRASSKWIKKQSTSSPFFQWQAGYGAFSISTNQIKTVRQYIENQQMHHQKIDFREEFIWLCEKHGVAYDQRYLWD